MQVFRAAVWLSVADNIFSWSPLAAIPIASTTEPMVQCFSRTAVHGENRSAWCHNVCEDLLHCDAGSFELGQAYGSPHHGNNQRSRHTGKHTGHTNHRLQLASNTKLSRISTATFISRSLQDRLVFILDWHVPPTCGKGR